MDLGMGVLGVIGLREMLLEGGVEELEGVILWWMDVYGWFFEFSCLYIYNIWFPFVLCMKLSEASNMCGVS